MVILREGSVILELKSRNKEEVLMELAEILHKDCPSIDLGVTHSLLKEREQVGSTGVGNGVAIPHAKIEDLDRVLICLGLSPDGINFDAIDNQPVSIIFMILSPADRPDEYLKELARVSRFLKQPEMRRKVRQASTQENITQLFNSAE